MTHTHLYKGLERWRVRVPCLVLLPAFLATGPFARGQEFATNFQLENPYEALPHQYRGQMHMHTVATLSIKNMKGWIFGSANQKTWTQKI